MMATYFEVRNHNTLKVSIDDTYRYFYEIQTLDLSNGANSPVKFKYYDEIWWDRGYGRANWVTKYKCLNSWQYMDAGSSEPYLDSLASCARYMSTIIPVNKDKIYAIRFKKASGTTKVWVRCYPTVLGAEISGDVYMHSLLIEVMTSEKTVSPAAALEYFDIVEIGNGENYMPVCKNGLQIFDVTGKEIFNSNCKMISVREMYTGDAGNVTISNANMLAPTTTYRFFGWNDYNGNLRYYMYRDAYWYDGNNIHNDSMYLPQMRVTPYEDTGAPVFDPREASFDADKTINGLVLTTLS